MTTTGPAFPPGVAEALAEMGATAPVAVVAAPKVRFLDGTARSKPFPLAYPVGFDGREIHAIVLCRLTTTEVAAFMEKLQTLDQKAREDLYWPIYQLEDGTPAPAALLDGLDADDMEVLTKAAQNFLPRRFRTEPDADLSPPNGASTAP